MMNGTCRYISRITCHIVVVAHCSVSLVWLRLRTHLQAAIDVLLTLDLGRHWATLLRLLKEILLEMFALKLISTRYQSLGSPEPCSMLHRLFLLPGH